MLMDVAAVRTALLCRDDLLLMQPELPPPSVSLAFGANCNLCQQQLGQLPGLDVELDGALQLATRIREQCITPICSQSAPIPLY